VGSEGFEAWMSEAGVFEPGNAVPVCRAGGRRSEEPSSVNLAPFPSPSSPEPSGRLLATERDRALRVSCRTPAAAARVGDPPSPSEAEGDFVERDTGAPDRCLLAGRGRRRGQIGVCQPGSAVDRNGKRSKLKSANWQSRCRAAAEARRIRSRPIHAAASKTRLFRPASAIKDTHREASAFSMATLLFLSPARSSQPAAQTPRRKSGRRSRRGARRPLSLPSHRRRCEAPA